MRKLATCAVVVLCGLSLSQSPALALDFFKVGIKGGVNLSRLNDEGTIASQLEGLTALVWDQQFRAGVIAGIFAQFDLSSTVALRPEALFSMKGEKYEPETAGKFITKLDYIEVPVLAVYRFPVKGNLRPGIFAGPALALEVSSELSGDGPGALVSGVLPETKTLDFSVVVGAEFVFEDRYSIEARLTQGFSNIDDMGTPPDVKNQTISILAGISFDIFNF